VVRELVPALWQGQKIDYAVHIGMASGRKFYSVERRGHRDGYVMRDVDNEFLGDAERRKREGTDWIWNNVPEELLSSVTIDDVWRRWRTALPVCVSVGCSGMWTMLTFGQDVDIRVSEDAGRYLCDFIYFSSLAYLTKKEEERRVVFLHVPVDSDEAALNTGTEVALELIRAMVQSGRMKKLVQQ
jgi:pyroglutamyl-peptidase